LNARSRDRACDHTHLCLIGQVNVFSSKDISYYIISLGCAKNQVDSERINGALDSAGYIQTGSSEHADIIIINTCGFITEAKEESIEVIFDALEQQKMAGKKNLKKFYQDNRVLDRDFGRRVVVVGCLSQRYREELEIEIPEVDFIHGIPDNNFVEFMSRKFSIDAGRIKSLREPLLPGLPYSYIKIAEGCSNNCSYCAIPLIRGPQTSYPADLVLDEARREAARGARELVIVAQDISAYRWAELGLPELVSAISRIDGVEWIRLMYCHPDHLDDHIIDSLRVEKVVPYIDIPFQHASSRILRSMGRKGGAGAYRTLVERLRERVPDIRIRSTFMVGYPGETNADFEELINFLEAECLDRVGAFIYSPEEGTRSWEMGDPVTDALKKERYHRIMTIQRDISARKLAAMAGSIVRVLVEEKVDETTCSGRTEYDAPDVDGIFYLTGRNVKINSIVKARVTGATEYDLIGEIVS
jgi:ribosomal protein S12 methylthiotransferase